MTQNTNTNSDTIATAFPTWYGSTRISEHQVWNTSLNWNNPFTLAQIIDLVIDECNEAANTSHSIHVITEIAAVIHSELLALEISTSELHIKQQLQFARFWLASSQLESASSAGCFPVAYDWLRCSLSDISFERSEPGQQLNTEILLERLVEYKNSSITGIQSLAPSTCARWIAAAFYYDKRQVVLHPVLSDFVGFGFIEFIVPLFGSTRESDQHIAVRALSQVAAWCDTYSHEHLNFILNFILELIDGTSPGKETHLNPNVRKTLFVALASGLGRHTAINESNWAKRALEEFAGTLHKQEEIVLLIQSKTGDEVTEGWLEDFQNQITDWLREYSEKEGIEKAQLLYNQIRLYRTLGPLLHTLMMEGRICSTLELTATWFGITENIRSTPAICFDPIARDGCVYAIEDQVHSFERDTNKLLRETTELANICLNTNVHIPGDPLLASHVMDGCNPPTDEELSRFNDQLILFFGLEELKDILASLPEEAGLLQFHSFQYPVQALMIKELGKTWPIIASLHEPGSDREIKRILCWTVGLESGQGADEILEISEYLSHLGVTVDTMVNQDLSTTEFLSYYESEEYDVIWIAAHGHYEASTPHESCLYISKDGMNKVLITDLLNCTIPQGDRRLLFLNICSGGTPLVADAPPRMGIGPITADSSQAVISHLWSVYDQHAADFGRLLAIGLIECDSFFSAFSYALSNLLLNSPDRKSLIDGKMSIPSLLIRDSGTLPERIMDIWGSPVFYE